MKKISIFLFILLFVTACSPETSSDKNESEQHLSKEQTLTNKKQEANTSIRIAMIGDILLHTQILHYKDYTPALKPIEKSLQSYDFLIANQESLAIGNQFALSSYPKFASPDFILRDLKEAGVDFLNLANNHVLDHGEAGLRTELENIKKVNLPYVGAYESAKDANTMRIQNVDGIKLGILSYTYGTNGLQVPNNRDYLVNYIDEKKIKRDIKAIRSKADVVIVNMHWGTEYTTKVNATQRHLAKIINEAGADIIFGGHPHILQPYAEMTNDDGLTTHIFYSIGNFYATNAVGKATLIGGAASFQITKQGDNLTIDQPEFKATAVLKDQDMYKVFPLKQVEKRAPENLQWVQQLLGNKVNVQ